MKRSKHSLSHFRLTSFNLGEITPVACLEILPGDSFRMQSQALIRVAPLVAPVMHPVKAQIHYWFVPNRILWDNWETFITDNQTSLLVPTVPAQDCAVLATDLGIGMPVATPQALSVNALPFRGYNKIYHEFYRDQDISPGTWSSANTNDGPDLGSYYVRRPAIWKKDYFTTARTDPQKGTAVGVTVPVTGISGAIGTGTMQIADWRMAMARQKIQEHRNWYGSRYKDYLAFLGVRASDSRLDRPEFLGGGSQMISFSEVLSTADTDTTTNDGSPLGDMAGHGIAAVSTPPFKKFFEEHGWLYAFMIVRPEPMYFSTVKRHFFYSKPENFWQKELEMFPTQVVTNREIWYQGNTSKFGVVGNHDHYRHVSSYVSGEFRNALMEWHYARDFAAQPVLNNTFLQCIPTTRVYADALAAQLRIMINHRISARRLVTKVARRV